MFCHQCGAENLNGSIYCHACGENISPEDAPLLEETTPTVTEEALVPVSDAVVLSEMPASAPSPVPAGGDARPMKLTTRVAYNVLKSDRKNVAIFLLCLVIVIAGIAAVASCIGLVSAFAGVSDASRALLSGIRSELIDSGINQAWNRVWANLIAIPLSLLIFFLGIRLLVRIVRVRGVLREVRQRFK